MNRMMLIIGFVLIGLILSAGCAGQPPTTPPPTTAPGTTMPPTTAVTPSPTLTTPTTTLPVTTTATTTPATTPPTTQPTPTQGGIASVEIRNFAFVPGTLTVSRGTTVTWTNQDSAPHTVVSDGSAPASFSSTTLSKGSTFSFTVVTPGTYRYHCGIHPSMSGTITVT